MKRRRFQFFTATFAAVTALSLAACGKAKDENAARKEWVYVPEFITIEEENVDYYDMHLMGEDLYYISYGWNEETMTSSQDICKYSLADKKVSTIPVTWLEEGGDQNIGNYSLGADGSLYAMVYSYSFDDEGEYENKEFLSKFGADGKQIFATDITKQMEEDPENSYVNGMAADAQGRLYVASNSVVWLYDAQGNYQGNVSLGSTMSSWINSIGCGKDGKVYVCYYSHDGNESGYSLSEIDFDKKQTVASYENFPGGNNAITPGAEKDFLVNDGNTLYEYDCETQSKTALLQWLESDINGTSVQTVGALPDGRLLAVINDWDTGDSGIALLTKTKASEVAQREPIVIATLFGDSDLQAAAVAFNKSNEKYRITIKNYIDPDSWSDTTWTDAMTNLNNDITSSSCPDIIDLSGLNVAQFAAKGVFEDLNKYLKESSVLKREDFVEGVLNACTYDNVLVSIPASFEMQTIVGSAEKVGTKMGWTLDEMIAFADKYPEAELFDDMSQLSMMYMLMMYNEDMFIDWETGKCSFDTKEFKTLLEFVNRFPDEINWEEGQPSTPTRIQNGEVLLDMAYIYDFESIQIYWEMFGGEITCIGYPSMDGSSGCAMGMSQMYAIASKSKNKEGAWAFIEGFLSKEDDGSYWYGFPSLKSKLENMKTEAMKVEYVTDVNGEPYLDENGEPIVMGGGGGIGYEDGWEYTYQIPTQKEVDIIMSLMEVAKPMSSMGEEQIMNIINEEAAAYWEGQKSVDEVASIIQSRIQIYVDENQ